MDWIYIYIIYVYIYSIAKCNLPFCRQQQHLENAKKTEEAAKAVGKPSDIFYAKMLPLLKKHGVTKMEESSMCTLDSI